MSEPEPIDAQTAALESELRAAHDARMAHLAAMSVDERAAFLEAEAARYAAERAQRAQTGQVIDFVSAAQLVSRARAAAEAAQRKADADAAAEAQRSAEHEQRMREDPDYRRKVKAEQRVKRDALVLASGVKLDGPLGEAAWSFQRWDPQAKAALQAYLRRADLGLGAVLQGDCGSGKSCGMKLLGDELARRDLPFRWVAGGRIVAASRRGYLNPEHEHYPQVAWLYDVPRLLVDDLSADDDITDYMRRDLLLWLDSRREAGLYTVVTTNSDPGAMMAAFGARFYSRLYDLAHMEIIVWETTTDLRTGLDQVRPDR